MEVMIKDLNEMLQELNGMIDLVHARAKSKGFHDAPSSVYRLDTLIASKLFEALAFLRKGWGLDEVVFYPAGGVVAPRLTEQEYYHGDYTLSANCGGYKPEGIPIDLADFIIRCLDVLGLKNVEHKIGQCFQNCGDDLEKLTAEVCVELFTASFTYDCWFNCIATVVRFCIDNHIPVMKYIHMKMGYNMTRPRLHGKVF